ncbi:hypothetical protein [Streptomyces sp. TP-A0874]|uniref:hypothetical protein n=1 Tax=Streptomyces sp. TP-A0874 TaxID=549819 RepID=UPI000852CE43|nr:hypothetical protein [Streptomyces sp. TP-A0874]
MSKKAGVEPGLLFARSKALAVLRVRGSASALALLPAALAVVLFTAEATGRLGGPGWDTALWGLSGAAVLVLLFAAAVSAVVVRARPALTPIVPIAESTAPELYRLVGELADRLEVPAPSSIALTPDCDSWLEERAHAAPEAADRRSEARRRPPVLVIGSPFLWWLRVAELRAVLAPVVAGTGPSAHPDIAAARRFVRGLDAAVAVSDRRAALAPVGWAVRAMLRGCREHAEQMERGVAVAASTRARTVDYGLRIAAQEQVGLAYAGWDRLLTRVALPAWRMGRWPARLDAGVVSALTELSRRDRLADGFTSRLSEPPACDLLEEPDSVDEAASLLAARLFHGGAAEPGPDWAPLRWADYPAEVVDRKWRVEAARLHRLLEEPPPPEVHAAPAVTGGGRAAWHSNAGQLGALSATLRRPPVGPTLAGVVDRFAAAGGSGQTERLAARLEAETSRAERPDGGAEAAPSVAPWDEGALPLFPLRAPRTGRELLADHIAAMVCCAAVDGGAAVPGMDWLDGPVLLIAGVRAADLHPPVRALLEDGDPAPLRRWLDAAGVRPEKPVRLV